MGKGISGRFLEPSQGAVHMKILLTLVPGPKCVGTIGSPRLALRVRYLGLPGQRFYTQYESTRVVRVAPF